MLLDPLEVGNSSSSSFRAFIGTHSSHGDFQKKTSAKASTGFSTYFFTKNSELFFITKIKKQIDYGKVTVDYEEYLVSVPKSSRKAFHPRTPDKYQKTSRRGFDSQIKNWKIKIHNWQNLDKKGKFGSKKKAFEAFNLLFETNFAFQK